MNIDFSSDFHMHSNYSDGIATIEDMVKSSIKKGLTRIAITDHMPLPFPTYYAVDLEQIQAYRDEIDMARQQYGHKIDILTGLEIEFMPEIYHWIKENILAVKWDFLIASVHGLLVDNSHCLINESEKEFDKTLQKVFNGDIQALCSKYYLTLQQAIKTGWCDSTGHLDVVKKFNQSNQYFDETSPWYGELVEETLDIMKTLHIKMEINTAGLIHPIGEIYPSPWIIKAAIKKNIPIIMGSDAHAPETPAQNFKRVSDTIQSRH